MPRESADRDPIRFAERVLALLDRGSFVATYKYAVLLGLMDLCLEGTSRKGAPPDMVTTRQLAEKVMQLYWPQTMPFFASKRGKVLLQNRGNQAKMLSDIVRFREGLRVNLASLTEARLSDPDGYERLVRDVEWTLILMPLPRVQVMGRREERVLYDIAWDLGIERNKRLVTQYQRTGGGTFDNRIMFKPRVSEHLVMLNGLLRPLIHREWVRMVAQINKMEESRLESFLFGVKRESMDKVRAGLFELQEGRCFYCQEPVGRYTEVDHFIPWARYPDNGIDNLVVAHGPCNRHKRDFLAASEHVQRWAERNADGSSSAGIDLRLPEDALLWQVEDEFVSADVGAIRRALVAA